MNTEEFLRNCYDPVLIGFYPSDSGICTEEIEISTQNFIRALKHIKQKYPNSFVDGFWSGNNQIIAHATYMKNGKEG